MASKSYAGKGKSSTTYAGADTSTARHKPSYGTPAQNSPKVDTQYKGTLSLDSARQARVKGTSPQDYVKAMQMGVSSGSAKYSHVDRANDGCQCGVNHDALKDITDKFEAQGMARNTRNIDDILFGRRAA